MFVRDGTSSLPEHLPNRRIRCLLDSQLERYLANMKEYERLAQEARDPQSKALYEFLHSQWRTVIDQLQNRPGKREQR